MSYGKEGAHIAVLGIDGIGKSLIVDGLEQRYIKSGRRVKRVSWRRLLSDDQKNIQPKSPNGALPLEDLGRLWVDALHLYLGGASVHGRPLRLPETYAETLEENTIPSLASLPITGLRSSGPLAVAWVELAGFTLIHHQVIRPLVDQGYVIIQESLGFKNVVKSLITAEYLDPSLTPAIDMSLRFMRTIFGEFLRPDIGVYLVADPELALKGKVLRGESPGPFESFGAAGGDAQATFLRAQSRCAVEFSSFADKYEWVRLDITEVSSSLSVERVVREMVELVTQISR